MALIFLFLFSIKLGAFRNKNKKENVTWNLSIRALLILNVIRISLISIRELCRIKYLIFIN